MRNIWAPLVPMDPEIERIVTAHNLVVYGRPIAQRVVEKVARYLALLDLLDRVTVTDRSGSGQSQPE